MSICQEAKEIKPQEKSSEEVWWYVLRQHEQKTLAPFGWPWFGMHVQVFYDIYWTHFWGESPWLEQMINLSKSMSSNMVSMRVWGKEVLSSAVTWEYGLVWSLWRTIWQHLLKFKMVTNDPANLLLGNYSREILPWVHKQAGKDMHERAIFNNEKLKTIEIPIMVGWVTAPRMSTS